MFLSVKERARQIAAGQFQPSQAPTSDQVAPPPSPKVPSKIVTAKFAPSKVAREKTASSPTTSAKKAAKTESKTESQKTARPKTESPKIASPKAASPKTKTPKPTSSKTAPPETSSPKTSSKSSSSKTSTPKTSAPKTSKTSSPKIASPKMAPAKPVRSKSPSKIGSFVEEPSEENTEISELKAACLKQASGVTGLGGRRLAIVLKQTSEAQWYAALKDLSSDKYLKMWMNRSKTFPTQVEALEAYLVFVKKMKLSCGLFPMSPKTSKSKP